jgi:hypothetical protein
MKNLKIRLVFTLILGLLVAWIMYDYRVRIEVWIWHLRHGTTITVNDYIVPVPKNWYVEDEGNGSQLLIQLDTADQTRYEKLKAHASILVTSQKSMKNQNVSFWRSLEKDALKKNGMESISERNLNINGDSLTCLGGNRPGPKEIYDIEPLAWHCRTSGGLELIMRATQPDLNQVWDIVSHISKNFPKR